MGQHYAAWTPPNVVVTRPISVPDGQGTHLSADPLKPLRAPADLEGASSVWDVNALVARASTAAVLMIVQSPASVRADHFDHCVVGAGPVGLTLALELSRLGQRVLVLESGGTSSDPETQALSEAELAEPTTHDDMRIAVARRLGGTSNLWGGRCLPYDAVDFMDRPGVLGPLWPIRLEDIAPHYPAACEYACCGDPVFQSPVPHLNVADDRFTCGTIERWSNKPRFQRAHGGRLARDPTVAVCLHATVVDLEIGSDHRVNAVLVAYPDGRRVRVPVKNLTLAAGGVETARLLLSVQRRLPSAFGGVDGPLGRYYMGHVIGQIADITFSTKAIDAALDFYVDGRGSYVRRRFVPSQRLQLEHRLTNVAFWPIVPITADPRHGSGVLSLAALVLSIAPLGRLLVAEAIRTRHVVHGMPILPHLQNVLFDLPRAIGCAAISMLQRHVTPMRLPGFYVRNRSMRYGLAYHAEQLPNAESRVRLTDSVDRLGLPRLQIDLRFVPEDATALVRTHELFADWLKATGVGRLDFRQPAEENAAAVRAQARHGTHQIGLVRMAGSAKEGVVDGDLRSFDFSNLFVVGAGVLPTSSQAAPTLTAMALAVRLARHLAGEQTATLPVSESVPAPAGARRSTPRLVAAAVSRHVTPGSR